MPPALTRFWFALDYGPNPYGSPSTWDPGPIGLGVTALDAADAAHLVAAWLADARLAASPTIVAIVADVDVTSLDDRVRLNMGPPNWRGVWFPIGSIA